MNWIQVAIGAVGAAIICWMAHSILMNHAEKKHQAKLGELQASLVASCNEDKKLTEEIQGAIQKNYDDLKSELESYKLRHPNKCVPIITRTARPAVVGSRPDESDGVNSDALWDYSANHCKRYWLERQQLEKFIDGVWSR